VIAPRFRRAELAFSTSSPQVSTFLGVCALALLVLLAVYLRLVPTLFHPSIISPDEIFQTIEQAHRLVYGTGLIPWEFQLGIRSWLLPGAIAGLMEASRLVGDGPDAYLPAVAVCLALLGSAPVACCYLWAKRMFGLAGAVVAGAVVATMPDLIYFGGHALAEVIAAHILVIATYIVYPGCSVTSSRRAFIGGALLALTFVLRVQLAPAIALVALQPLASEPRSRFAALVAGAGAVVGCAAVLDTLTLGSPLASIWRYALYNLGYGVSSTFGVQPWFFYVLIEPVTWGSAFVVLCVCVQRGVQRLPLLFWTALLILVVHSAIGHKEYRFIYPTLVLLSILAGIGLAEITYWTIGWLRRKGVQKTIAESSCTTVVIAFWTLSSFHIWNGQVMRGLAASDRDNLRAASFVAHGSTPCGIGFFGHGGIDWVLDGGYTYLHWPVPMYWPKDEAELAKTAAGFDTLIYTEVPPAGSDFKVLQCFREVCVARRKGACVSVQRTPMPVPEPIAHLEPPNR
jgi:hypothetical protein